MQLPNVLQNIILDYLCPMDTVDAIQILSNPFQNDLIKWTITRQIKETKDVRCFTTFAGDLADKIHITNCEYIIKVGNDIHCVDGPAIVTKHGKYWVQHNQLHRKDGPAVENEHGTFWFQNGNLHRLDGPAYETKNEKKWYDEGVLHRLNGPAVVDKDKKWYKNGILHRVDGPAIEACDGSNYWYQHGFRLDEWTA